MIAPETSSLKLTLHQQNQPKDQNSKTSKEKKLRGRAVVENMNSHSFEGRLKKGKRKRKKNSKNPLIKK